MHRRAYIYDGLSVVLVLGSLYFFFVATQFLIDKDYVAAALTTFIAILVVRVGVELGKLALLMRRRHREEAKRQAS